MSESTRGPEQHISFLDPIRGIAILGVFLYHSLGATFGFFQLDWNGLLRDFHAPRSYLALLPASYGWLGVAVFFVVSGFCIHISHQRSRQKGFTVFFIRRFFRIYPPYLLVLCFFAFVYPPTKLDFSSKLLHTQTNFAYSCVTTAAHALLVHNYSKLLDHDINGSFWSIAVEVQLYIIYPLLLWLVGRMSWRRIMVLTGVLEIGLRGLQGIVTLVHPPFDPPGWYIENPIFFWFSWSIGAALAEAYLKKEPLPFRSFSLLLWPAATLVCFWFKPLFPFCFTTGALSTATAIAYLLEKPNPLPTTGVGGLVVRHLSFAGTVSYSAYLIHQPLVDIVPGFVIRNFGLHPESMLVYASCLLAWFPILGISYLIYLWVETPSIGWGKRVISHLGAGKPPVVKPTGALVEKPALD
jgi:peptidoglycan/LPS O-acetylase OafA/YrhL